MRIAIVLTGILLLVSGCVDANTAKDKDVVGKASKLGRQPVTIAEIKEAAFDKVKELMAGVPCQVPAVGPETSKNLRDLTQIKWEKGGTSSLDFRGDIMIAAKSGGMGIVNISNPLEPWHYANFSLNHGYGDVKISPDNMTAIGGAGGTIDLVDIRDPFQPVLAGQWRLSQAGRQSQGFLNAHMLYTAMIKGEQWVFVAANNNDGVWILKLKGPPEKRELEFITSTLPIEGGPLGPHDMWVNYDVDLKKWLLYSADGFHGWAVFDVSDPAKPMLAGGLVRPETGYTHTIQAAKIGGKRIVATIAEVGVNLLEVYDATVLQAPVLLGAWHVNEARQDPPQPLAPQHEFNIVDGKLYLGHYANGFYVFDLTKVVLPVAGSADLKPMAHYAAGTPTITSLFSQVWSVDIVNGVLYTSDMGKGVAVVGFGCNVPGDAKLTSNG
ncbi:MAG: hypothetical protein HYT80_02605 [Euryarchaeota archaeon]|nr:hypothetical protein [Euryarchaeota archaeon]